MSPKEMMNDLNKKHMERYGFMKNSMSRNDDRMSMKTKEFVTFHDIWISNKDT